MPRCRISVPAPQSSKRYFPRRVTVLISRPQSVRSSSGTGQRRFGFRTVKPAILRPSSPEAMPRRTTSTSGSSGNSNVGMECWDKEVAGYGQGRGNTVQDSGFTELIGCPVCRAKSSEKHSLSSFTSPPYRHPAPKENQRHHDEESPGYYRQCWLLQGQAVVDGRSWLD